MDKYKTIKYINQGSFGRIYLVENRETKELFAMKSIKIEGIDRYSKLNILNEIKILLINKSKYLLNCYDLFIHNKKLCIITEYIDGGDLDNYIKKNNKISEDDLIKIFLKICIGISSLHKNSIVHRDIKPANILITKEGEIKICDFGICKFLNYNKVTNTFIGTPYYMSPEQMNQQYYDYKVDVWGIGCVLYHLLYNKYPFNGRSMNELKKNIKLKDPFTNISNGLIRQNDPSNLPKLEKIVREMMNKNKNKRTDLSIFLKNSESIINYYDILLEEPIFKKYNIKSIPYFERDWTNILNNIKREFGLPKNQILKYPNINDKIPILLSEKPKMTIPDIITYNEIRNKKIPKMPEIKSKYRAHPPAYPEPRPPPIRQIYSPSRPAPQRPAQQRPAQQRPAPQRPAQQRPAYSPSRPAQQRPAQQRPAPQRPAPQRPAPQRPAPQRPAPQRPAQQRPTQTRLAPQRPSIHSIQREEENKIKSTKEQPRIRKKWDYDNAIKKYTTLLNYIKNKDYKTIQDNIRKNLKTKEIREEQRKIEQRKLRQPNIKNRYKNIESKVKQLWQPETKNTVIR